MSIYVSIPCLGDEELEYTVRDIFENADSPESIYIGIAMMTGKDYYEKESVKFLNNPNISIEYFDVEKNKGVGIGRHNAASLYSGQDYMLQIDSHTLLQKGWDSWLLSLYKEAVMETGSEKTVLTAYLPPYTHNSEGRFFQHNRFSYPFFYQEKLPGHYIIPAWFETSIIDIPKEKQRSEKFLPSVKFNAQFAFGNKNFVNYTGLEKDFLFYEEEIIQSINLIDKNFALVFPNSPSLIAHMYIDNRETNTKRTTVSHIYDSSFKFHLETNDRYTNFIRSPENKEKCEKYQKYAKINLISGPRYLYYTPESYFI